tara:strand:- start:90 stop:290 length:201 start_codon:yes stop_codon:yes gene_type:complete
VRRSRGIHNRKADHFTLIANPKAIPEIKCKVLTFLGASLGFQAPQKLAYPQTKKVKTKISSVAIRE